TALSLISGVYFNFVIGIVSQNIDSPTNPVRFKTEEYKILFDIEKYYKNSGDQVICEMINIVGLLNEHNFDQIELTTLERNLNTYEELMNYISPRPKAKEEGKQK
ncbi:hypothetical protein, partial [Acinetobacter guillouiae]|uniref:hypothetical protein n=1 Tax=Acinetobacter guillouiae TaxID=106649 RepID=UPI003AF530BC